MTGSPSNEQYALELGGGSQHVAHVSQRALQRGAVGGGGGGGVRAEGGRREVHVVVARVVARGVPVRHQRPVAHEPVALARHLRTVHVAAGWRGNSGKT